METCKTQQGFLLIPRKSGQQQNKKIPAHVYHGKYDELNIHRVITDVHQDMSQPFSRYWISSSHASHINKQSRFSSSAGVDGIEECLLSGCRSIELVCREPKRKKDQMIRVDNGKLVGNSSIDLEACLQTIRENAFKTSKYPVILMLDSCITDVERLDYMADILHRILGNMLYVPQQGNAAIHQPHISPQQLRLKVILKMRATAEVLISKLGQLVGMRESLQQFADNAQAKDYISEGQKGVSVSICEPKIVHWLRDGDESQIASLHVSMQQNIKSSNLFRVIPKTSWLRPSRILNPWAMWVCGVHQVSLDWHHHGDEVFTNLAFFRNNGACGYVLQPSWICSPNESRFFRTIEIHCFGLITATFTGDVEIEVNVCGTEQQFQNLYDDDCFQSQQVAEFEMDKCGHGNPNLDFKYRAIRCSVQEDVGIIVVCVKMNNVKSYAVVPINSLRPGLYLHQLLNDRGRVSTKPTDNDCLALEIIAP
eukprot:m.132535 g.132535  ORF g.132535 m.132535 type:complete len:481 (-) comp29612_c0_seq1:209-1651(-)